MLSTLLLQATLALDAGDEVGGGDGGADFEFGFLWGFAFEVGEEAFQVWGLGRLFVHGKTLGTCPGNGYDTSGPGESIVDSGDTVWSANRAGRTVKSADFYLTR